MKSLNVLMAALVVELIEGEIPHPMQQEFPIFALWSDLARLAGEAVPHDIAALLDTPAVERLAASPPAFRAALAEPVRVVELEPA